MEKRPRYREALSGGSIKKSSIKKSENSLENDELKVLMNVLPPFLEWEKTSDGIFLRLSDHRSPDTFVRIPPDIIDEVCNCLHNHGFGVDKKKWMRIRDPIMNVIAEIIMLQVKYGDPLGRKVLREMFEQLQRSRQHTYRSKSIG